MDVEEQLGFKYNLCFEKQNNISCKELFIIIHEIRCSTELDNVYSILLSHYNA